MNTVDRSVKELRGQLDKLRDLQSFATSITNASSAPTQAVIDQARTQYQATSVAIGTTECENGQDAFVWRSVNGTLSRDELPNGLHWANAAAAHGHGAVYVPSRAWASSDTPAADHMAVITFDDGAGLRGILCLFSSLPSGAVDWRTNDLSRILADLALATCALEKEHERLGRADEQAVLLTRLFNSTSEGIWSVGLDGLITFVNEAAIKMFAFDSAEQMLGRNSHELVHHSYADGTPYPKVLCPIFRAFNEGVPAHLTDEVLWRADGTSFFAEYRTCPVFNHGKIIGTVTTFCDNTERRAVRQKLIDHADNLAVTISELEQERALRDRFTNSLTHDLRAPISAAQLNAQLLARKAGDVPIVKTVTGRIITNTKRADHMIQNLLDANRLKAGQELALATADIRLDTLLEGCVAELNQIHGKRVVFENRAAAVNCRCDASSLLRVMDNIVGNAVKYGAADTPITVSLMSSGTMATIAVHNFGDPIGEAEQETLFEPFTRLATAEKSGQKGWGLGLSLVKEIIARHGGHVRCDSAQHTGTTFSLDLPISPANV